jgi:hypothetical protein
LDFVVARETLDDPDRCFVDRRQVRAELDQCLGLDALDQMNQHLIENTDLLLIEAIRFLDKQSGDTPESFKPSFGLATLDGGFQFRNQGKRGSHVADFVVVDTRSGRGSMDSRWLSLPCEGAKSCNGNGRTEDTNNGCAPAPPTSTIFRYIP